MSAEDLDQVARRPREPTSWTVPMQRTAAGFLTASVLWSIASNALWPPRTSTVGLTAAEVRSAAQLDSAVSWAAVIVLGTLFLVLAAGGLRRWRWAFWADLVAFAFGSAGVVTNALALTRPDAQTQPAGATAVGLALSVASLALLLWFAAAAARFGPWAMRRPGRG